MKHLITTSDRKRKQMWLRLFGRDALPVLAAAPRWQEHPDGAVLAYDLALAELHPGDRWRFASYISRRYRMDYDEALRRVETAVSWPLVDNGDLMIVETAEEKRPFLFLRQLWARVANAA